MSLLSNSNSLLIDGPTGHLELAVNLPPEPLNVPAIAIICHPHPLFGGTMQNKVVTTLANTFNELGMISIRFNYRGIGKSIGTYGEGTGEIADLLAVYDWVRQQQPTTPIWLAGFSFGAYISLAGATQRPVARLISIAPAVHLFDFIKLTEPACPWLIVQGEEDEITDPHQVYEYIARRNHTPSLIRMPKTSHFFHGQLLNLKQQLKDHLRL